MYPTCSRYPRPGNDLVSLGERLAQRQVGPLGGGSGDEATTGHPVGAPLIGVFGLRRGPVQVVDDVIVDVVPGEGCRVPPDADPGVVVADPLHQELGLLLGRRQGEECAAALARALGLRPRYGHRVWKVLEKVTDDVTVGVSGGRCGRAGGRAREGSVDLTRPRGRLPRPREATWADGTQRSTPEGGGGRNTRTD